MADIKSPDARSHNMSRIRSRDTKPEEYIRKKLFARGYRYRKNSREITGHPDAWFPKYRTALFIHGCYWHRHKGCKYAYTPKTRVSFWTDKFNSNIRRDKLVKQELVKQGIRVLVVWECIERQMRKSAEHESRVLDMIEDFLHGNKVFMEI